MAIRTLRCLLTKGAEKKKGENFTSDEKKEKTTGQVDRWPYASDGHPSLITIWKVLVAPPSDFGVLPAQLYIVWQSLNLVAIGPISHKG